MENTNRSARWEIRFLTQASGQKLAEGDDYDEPQTKDVLAAVLVLGLNYRMPSRAGLAGVGQAVRGVIYRGPRKGDKQIAA
jgi:hypothetical protein